MACNPHPPEAVGDVCEHLCPFDATVTPSLAVGLQLDIFSWLLKFSLEKGYGGIGCSPNERGTLPCCLMTQQAA